MTIKNVLFISIFIVFSGGFFAVAKASQVPLDDAVMQLKTVESELVSSLDTMHFHTPTPHPAIIDALNGAVEKACPALYQETLSALADAICSHETTLDGIINNFLTDYHVPLSSVNRTMLMVVFLQETAGRTNDTASVVAQRIKKQFDHYAQLFFSILQKKQETLMQQSSSKKKWLLLALLLVGCWGGYKLYTYCTQQEPVPVKRIEQVAAVVNQPEAVSQKATKHLEQQAKLRKGIDALKKQQTAIDAKIVQERKQQSRQQVSLSQEHQDPKVAALTIPRAKPFWVPKRSDGNVGRFSVLSRA